MSKPRLSVGQLAHRWISLVRSDYPLNRTAPESVATTAIWRMGQVVDDRPGVAAFVLRRVHGVVDQLWVRNVIGAELPRSVEVGPGLCMNHGGRGVIMHPAATLGANVTLQHRVTVGVRGNHRAPVLGDGVRVGAGASILGPVLVAEGARVGAGAVVVKDVPASATAVGVPARIIPAHSRVLDVSEQQGTRV